MTTEQRISKAKVVVDILKKQELLLMEDLERLQGRTDQAMIYLYKLQNDIKEDDIVFVNGHKSIVSGFTVTKDKVKPTVKKFKKDRSTGEYKEIMYANDYTVQHKDKLEKQIK